MFLHKISEKELSAAIKNLKNKYSSDYDGLNNFILKKIQFAIVPTLTYLVYKRFENSGFFNCLKKAVIFPLYKYRDPKVAEIGSEKNAKFSGKIKTTEQKSIWV